jgi:hypothetical protein
MFDLRRILRLDALASGGLGVLLLVASGPAEELLGLPVALSLTVGGLLLAWAGFVGWVSTHLRRAWVAEVVALNLAYVVASVVFALAGWVALTGPGVAFVLAQAVAVLGLTTAQAASLRAGRVVTA